jgi:hypothetical protein
VRQVQHHAAGRHAKHDRPPIADEGQRSAKVPALSFLLTETITAARDLLPFTARYMAYFGTLITVMVFLPLSLTYPVYWHPFGLAAILVSLSTPDLLPTRHRLLRSYPIVGLRFLLGAIRPEIRPVSRRE